MEKTIIIKLCDEINKLDISENKDIFINKYKEIGIKVQDIDKYLNEKNEDTSSSKTVVDIIEELVNLNMNEINNNISIEKLKYYNELLKKYDELIINGKNDINYV